MTDKLQHCPTCGAPVTIEGEVTQSFTLRFPVDVSPEMVQLIQASKYLHAAYCDGVEWTTTSIILDPEDFVHFHGEGNTLSEAIGDMNRKCDDWKSKQET